MSGDFSPFPIYIVLIYHFPRTCFLKQRNNTIFQKENLFVLKSNWVNMYLYLFYLLEKHGNLRRRENIKCILIWICHRRFLDIVAEMLSVTKWGE